jgi:hypothetical protein
MDNINGSHGRTQTQQEDNGGHRPSGTDRDGRFVVFCNRLAFFFHHLLLLLLLGDKLLPLLSKETQTLLLVLWRRGRRRRRRVQHSSTAKQARKQASTVVYVSGCDCCSSGSSGSSGNSGRGGSGLAVSCCCVVTRCTVHNVVADRHHCSGGCLDLAHQGTVLFP